MKPNIGQVSFYIDKDIHRKLRLISLLKGESASERVEKLIKDYLNQNKITQEDLNEKTIKA